MKKLENLQNVEAPTGDYPYGDLKNNTGSNDGTPVNRDLLTDLVQFAQKLADEAGITINDVPDNETDGWQLYEAFRKLTKPYKVAYLSIDQTSTNAPVVTVVGINEIGTITPTRTSAGSYRLTSTGNFTVGKTFVLYSQSLDTQSLVKAVPLNVNEIQLASYAAQNAAPVFVSADDLIDNMQVQIIVFD
jgi:hypothetical protein